MFDQELLNIKDDIEQAMSFESESDEEDYLVNLSAKEKLLLYITKKQKPLQSKKISQENFHKNLNLTLDIIKKNTGCAEDLEIAEKILDRLIQLEIISLNKYREILEESPANRWF